MEPKSFKSMLFDRPEKDWSIDPSNVLCRFQQACNRVTRYQEVVVPEPRALRRIGSRYKIARLPAPTLTRGQVEAVFRMVRRDGHHGRIVAADLLGNAAAPLLALMVRKDKLAFRQQLVGAL